MEPPIIPPHVAERLRGSHDQRQEEALSRLRTASERPLAEQIAEAEEVLASLEADKAEAETGDPGEYESTIEDSITAARERLGALEATADGT